MPSKERLYRTADGDEIAVRHYARGWVYRWTSDYAPCGAGTWHGPYASERGARRAAERPHRRCKTASS